MSSNIIALRRRIRSVSNTLKTTAAMQMISSVKMRRSTEAAMTSRTFMAEAQRLLARITQSGSTNHPLLTARPTKKVLLVVVTSDKGLAGSYNSDVVRQSLKKIDEYQQMSVKVRVVTVGRKASIALHSVKGVEIIASFDNLPDNINFHASTPISQLIMKEYAAGSADQVIVVYQQFVSTIVQRVEALTLIPLTPTETTNEDPAAETQHVAKYEFEPNDEEVLAAIAPYLIQMNAWQILLEAKAAEHAARMVAMKNATDAGNELVSDLTFTANQVRQAAITAEIAEIAAGAAAINK